MSENNDFVELMEASTVTATALAQTQAKFLHDGPTTPYHPSCCLGVPAARDVAGKFAY